jgi:4-hydroxy-tetrahydrodipicolinate synthase
MLLTASASGVFPIAPTPFLPDGAVDWTSVDNLFSFYDKIGSDGTTVLGIMGEAPKLEPEESLGIVKRAVARHAGQAGHRRRLGAGLCRDAHAGAPVDGTRRGRSDDRPAAILRTDDQITGYYAQAIEAIG